MDRVVNCPAPQQPQQPLNQPTGQYQSSASNHHQYFLPKDSKTTSNQPFSAYSALPSNSNCAYSYRPNVITTESSKHRKEDVKVKTTTASNPHVYPYMQPTEPKESCNVSSGPHSIDYNRSSSCEKQKSSIDHHFSGNLLQTVVATSSTTVLMNSHCHNDLHFTSNKSDKSMSSQFSVASTAATAAANNRHNYYSSSQRSNHYSTQPSPAASKMEPKISKNCDRRQQKVSSSSSHSSDSETEKQQPKIQRKKKHKKKIHTNSDNSSDSEFDFLSSLTVKKTTATASKVSLNDTRSSQSSAVTTTASSTVAATESKSTELLTNAIHQQTSLASPAPVLKQTTCSTILSDDCNSIESPLSVDSNGKDSGKDDSGRSLVKKRDPAEERQRLRNYRIPYRLLQNRVLSRVSETTTTTSTSTTTTIATTTTSAAIVTSKTVMPTTAAVTSSTSTTVVTTKAGMAPKSDDSASDSKVKEKIALSKANTTTTDSKSNKKTSTSVPVSKGSFPNHFINPSFIVPGAPTFSGFSQHYPFSPTFMPAIFNNQFLHNVSNAKTNSNSNRFFHPTPSQSQLTIFTSPTLGSNPGTATALSPFSFPGVGNMPHQTLLSPTFSPSGLSTGTGSTTSLLVPKSLNFSPNISFSSPSDQASATAAAAHSLMLGFKPTTTSSSTSGTSQPPFILPRIVTTSNTSTTNPVISSVLSKSRTKDSGVRSTASSSKSPALIKPAIASASTLILPTTSASSSSTASQHSPLSILHPQTLLLLQPQMTPTSFGTSKASSSTSKTTTTTSKVSPKNPLQTTVQIPKIITAKPISTASPLSPPTVRAPLQNSVIFASNSQHQHLPYTLFQQPPQTLMQPISIQASPPPPPPSSSILGPQLLLSVISPNNRNQLNSLASHFNVSNNVVLSKSTTSATATSTTKSTAKPRTEASVNLLTTVSKITTSTVASKVAPKTTTSTIQAKPTLTTPVKSLPPVAPKTSKSTTVASQSNSKNSNLFMYSTIDPAFFTTTFLSPTFPVKDIPRNVITTTSVPTTSSYSSLPKSTAPEVIAIKSPPKSAFTPISPTGGVDEFESLVRSVKDTINSFNTSSADFYEDEVKKSSNITSSVSPAVESGFNSKKMLSLMITSNEKPITNAKKPTSSDNKGDSKIETKPSSSSTVEVLDADLSKLKKSKKKDEPSPKSVEEVKEEKISDSKKKKKKKRKDKRKTKEIVEHKSGVSLPKSSKKFKEKNRSKRSKNSACTDPVLLARIDNLTTRLQSVHISSSAPTVSSSQVPSIFRRVSFSKMLNRGRSRAPSRSKTTSVSSKTQCLLPLKKRHHRDPEEPELKAKPTSRSNTPDLAKRNGKKKAPVKTAQMQTPPIRSTSRTGVPGPSTATSDVASGAVAPPCGDKEGKQSVVPLPPVAASKTTTTASAAMERVKRNEESGTGDKCGSSSSSSVRQPHGSSQSKTVLCKRTTDTTPALVQDPKTPLLTTAKTNAIGGKKSNSGGRCVKGSSVNKPTERNVSACDLPPNVNVVSIVRVETVVPSNVDEELDADDEFDSDEECSERKSSVLKNASIVSLETNNTTSSTSHLHSPVDEMTKVCKQRPAGKKGSKNGSKKSIADPEKNGDETVVGSASIGDIKSKKKRKRPINKTGFDKPRKRCKVAKTTTTTVTPKTISKPQPENKSKTNNSKLSRSNGYSSQSEIDDRKQVLKNNSNRKKASKECGSSSTEVEEETKVTTRKAKQHHAKAKRRKTNISDSDSDSEQQISSFLSSATSSQNEDNDDDDFTESYPVYEVSKPSKNAATKKYKVHKITANPFRGKFQGKKYYQSGIFASDFGTLHKSEDVKDILGDRELVDVPTGEEGQSDVKSLPLLPFPWFCLSTESSASSCASSQEEDDKDLQLTKRKLPKRSKLNRVKSNPDNRDLYQDYKLNLDIWYLYKHNVSSSSNYRRVKQNSFVDMKPTATHCHQACNCVKSKNSHSACGSDCINRLMYQECNPKNCPAGETCSNQRIQRYDWSPGLERFMTSKRGWGIRTTEKIKAGDFILEYIGEIVSNRLFQKRMNERYRNDQHHYCLKIDGNMVIDGYRVADEGRFVNHSCEPNCEMQKWAVNEYYRIAMFATRDIEPYEELFYDYNFHNFNLDSQQICHCGSSKCRGFIGGRTKSLKLVNEPSVASNSSEPFLPNDDQKDIYTIDLRFGPLVAYTRLPPNDPLCRMFLFHSNKSKKVKIPISTLKDFVYCKCEEFSNKNTTDLVEVRYDPFICKSIKPLGYKLKMSVLKYNCFIIRNFERTRRLYMVIMGLLDSNGNKENGYSDEKESLKSINRYRVNNNDLNGNSSDDSSNSRMSSCSIRTRGVTRNDLSSRMPKQSQLMIDVCNQVSLFVKESLLALLLTGNEDGISNVMKSINGVVEYSKNGNVKRRLSRINYENNLQNIADSGLFNFILILNRIKSGQLRRMEMFEREIFKYIDEQFDELKSDLVNVDSKIKKLKLSKPNGVLEDSNDENENSEFDESIRFDSVLDRDKIMSLHKQVLKYFKDTLTVKTAEMNNNKANSAERLVNGFCVVNQSKLSDENRDKLLEFSSKLNSADKMHLYDSFAFERAVEKEFYTKNDPSDKPTLPPVKSQDDPNEDVIRCICGIMREEGNMIQCDKCQIWQHLDCVQQYSDISLSDNDHEFACEVCTPKNIPTEITLPHFNIPKITFNFPVKYYLTLDYPMIKEKRIKVGDCVYIYRHASTTKLTTNSKNSKDIVNGCSDDFIKTIGEAANAAIKNRTPTFNRRDCIIVRVQHLAIIESTNQRMLFGHHYIWPRETYHEPNRKFFTNEVLRSPMCEWAALEEVQGVCCVLDQSTYVRGRPRGFELDDVYICEFRVDRDAKSFSRIPKSGRFPVNVKNYAFQKYDEKLSIRRTYSPHQIPDTFKKAISKKDETAAEQQATSVKQQQLDEMARKKKMVNLLKISNNLCQLAYCRQLLAEQQKVAEA